VRGWYAKYTRSNARFEVSFNRKVGHSCTLNKLQLCLYLFKYIKHNISVTD